MTYLLAKVNVTGQWWVNELSNFNFSIYYKPGIENVAADSLSRYPLLQECNLEQYSQHLNPDEVKSSFDAVINQVGNNETWVAAVNTINTVFSDIENQILYDLGDQKRTLASQDLAKYQQKKNGYSWSFNSRKKESILINMHTNSYPESLKSFCESGTTYRCMKISYTSRSNNNQNK